MFRIYSLKCNYFLTTDDELIKKAMGIDVIKITDPISYIMML